MRKLLVMGMLALLAAPMFAGPAPKPAPASEALLTLTYYWLPG